MFMVHENWRFRPWYREIRKLLDAGTVGNKIHSIYFRSRMGDGRLSIQKLGEQEKDPPYKHENINFSGDCNQTNKCFHQSGLRIRSAGSSGIVCGVKTACNSDCPGHLLYGGLSRVTPDLGDLSGFDPVLKAVKSKLIHIECHSNDKTFGVGGCQSLKSGSITGVVPIGLHDGYRPAIPGQTVEMLIREQRVPVLSVSQECTVLDITAIHDPQLGEEVIVLGESGNGNIAIEEMPQWFGGIPLDVLMMFNERLPYRYLGDLFS